MTKVTKLADDYIGYVEVSISVAGKVCIVRINSRDSTVALDFDTSVFNAGVLTLTIEDLDRLRNIIHAIHGYYHTLYEKLLDINNGDYTDE